MSFLAELRRRNVIRMAGLYLVGAWLVVQVAAALLPVFEAPGWVMKVLVALLAAGFVVALVFSWIYELTPEGLKRDGDVPPAESIAPQTARRMDRMIMVVMALALVYFAFDKFVLGGHRAPTAPSDAAATETGGPAAKAPPASFNPAVDNSPAPPIVAACLRPSAPRWIPSSPRLPTRPGARSWPCFSKTTWR